MIEKNQSPEIQAAFVKEAGNNFEKKDTYRSVFFFKNQILENIRLFFKNHINLTFLRGPPEIWGDP